MFTSLRDSFGSNFSNSFMKPCHSRFPLHSHENRKKKTGNTWLNVSLATKNSRPIAPIYTCVSSLSLFYQNWVSFKALFPASKHISSREQSYMIFMIILRMHDMKGFYNGIRVIPPTNPFIIPSFPSSYLVFGFIPHLEHRSQLIGTFFSAISGHGRIGK